MEHALGPELELQWQFCGVPQFRMVWISGERDGHSICLRRENIEEGEVSDVGRRPYASLKNFQSTCMMEQPSSWAGDIYLRLPGHAEFKGVGTGQHRTN